MPRYKFPSVRLLMLASLMVSGAARADELADVQRLHYAGQTTTAMQRADQFLASRPKDPQMRFLKGVMLSDSHLDTQAIEQFQKLADDYPDLAEPYNNLATLYAAAGDYTKARVTLEQALRTNPGYATAHENLGDVHAALAGQSYARALRLEPMNVTVPPKLALVRELYKRGDGSGRPTSPTPAPALSNPTR